MRDSKGQDIEAEIFKAWLALRRMPAKWRRTLHLTARRHVVWHDYRTKSPQCVEIGTYNNAASLVDLQEDVLWAERQLASAEALMKDD